jgi:hypothetical protein
MSEPPLKRQDTWRTGTTQRYWKLIEDGRFTEARRLLQEGCTKGDSEAWFEMACIHEYDDEMTLARMAYAEATSLGHPVAFCYMAHGGKLSLAMIETGHVEDEIWAWSSAERHHWSFDYVTNSGSLLARWAWQWIFLGNGREDGPYLECLAEVASQEDTPFVDFLIAEITGDYTRAAKRNHFLGCFRQAGGPFGNGVYQRRGSTVATQEERNCLLHTAAVQGCRSAIVSTVAWGLASQCHANRWRYAKMLTDMAENISEDTVRRDRVIGIMTQRYEQIPSEREEWPLATLRETGFYSRFLLKHFIPTARGGGSIARHGTSLCTWCLELPSVFGPHVRTHASRTMHVYAEMRDRARAASWALLAYYRKRKRGILPFDLALLIAKSVWDTRITQPQIWSVENMNVPEKQPTDDQVQQSMKRFYMKSDWQVYNHEDHEAEMEMQMGENE